MNKFYIIDTDLSLEENMKLRDEFYTEEVLSSYDEKTREIIEKDVLDDSKFKMIYDIKLGFGNLFIECNQFTYDIITQI